MNEPTNYLAIYPYPVTANFDFLRSTLQKHFDIFTVTSVTELREPLKKQTFFCNLIHGRVSQRNDLREIRKISLAFSKISMPLLWKSV